MKRWSRHVHKNSVCILIALLFLAPIGSALAAPAIDSGHVVRVSVERPYGRDSERYGFWINDGHLLSELRPLGEEDRVRIEALDGSAIGSAEVIAQAEEAQVALLAVSSSGSGGPAMPFARVMPDTGDRLFGVEADGAELAVRRGSISQFLDEDRHALMRHNALVAEGSNGLPLVNRCGEVVGITLTSPDFLDRLFGDADPRSSGVAYAARVDWLRGFLDRAGVEYTEAAGICLSAEAAAAQEAEASSERAAEVEAQLDQAREEMEQARERRERIAEEAKALRERLEASESQTDAEKQALLESVEQAEAALEEAQRESARSEENVAALQNAFDRLEAENERQRRLLHYGAAGGGIALAIILLGVVLMRRRAARTAQSLSAELAEARDREDDQQEFDQRVAVTPDVLLEMRSPEDERFAVKLEARKLVSSGGAIVGRSPNEADYVLGHDDMSRRHARFYMAGAQLVVEDLGSTNGTFVEGEAIHEEPTPVEPGASIEFGALSGRVSY
jgi:hypothetical protein